LDLANVVRESIWGRRQWRNIGIMLYAHAGGEKAHRRRRFYEAVEGNLDQRPFGRADSGSRGWLGLFIAYSGLTLGQHAVD